MFGPSVKSVPGWWVSIVPMLIGVPVAATPGFGPHAEAPVLADVDVLLVAVFAAVLLVLLVAGVLLLLELPQPASANAPTTAESTANSCTREPCWDFLTCLSSFADEGTNPPRLMARRV
jgi:hypothetical protein